MAIVETSITINKPVEAVYAYLTNLQNQKKLNPNLTEVVVSGPVAVGTKFSQKGTVMGRTFESHNEIVALEPNKKFGIKTIAAPPASDVTNTYLLEKDGKGTKLTLQMDTVIMAMGMEAMVTNQLKTSLDTTLAATKKAVEG
jgi:ligand-binding SRPBCC domain-containing protein